MSDHSEVDESAVAEMREAGLEPGEPYPGKVRLPWQSKCMKCGAVRLTSLMSVRAGARCQHAQRGRLGAESAVAEMREAGLEPGEPYPGKVRLPWQSKCMKCGAVRLTSLMAVRAGERCWHTRCGSIVVKAAVELRVRAAGWEPQEPYPGRATAVWRLRHVGCGRVKVDWSAQDVLANRCVCVPLRKGDKVLLREAVDRAREAGWEPLEPYSPSPARATTRGGRRARWKARHVACGRVDWVTLDRMMRGGACRCATNPGGVPAPGGVPVVLRAPGGVPIVVRQQRS